MPGALTRARRQKFNTRCAAFVEDLQSLGRFSQLLSITSALSPALERPKAADSTYKDTFNRRSFWIANKVKQE